MRMGASRVHPEGEKIQSELNLYHLHLQYGNMVVLKFLRSYVQFNTPIAVIRHRHQLRTRGGSLSAFCHDLLPD